MAHLEYYFDSLSPHQLNKKYVVKFGPPLTNFLDPRMHLSLLIFVPMIKCRVKVAPDLSKYENNYCMTPEEQDKWIHAFILKTLVMVMNIIVCKQYFKNIVTLYKYD